MRFVKICEFFKTEESLKFFLRYGNDNIKIKAIHKCPNCGSSNILDLYHDEGNTIQGFLPNSASLYKLCRECELVYLSRQINSQDLKVYYQPFSYGREQTVEEHLVRWKNQNENNTSHFSNYLHGKSRVKNKHKLLDLGSGDGNFVAMIREKHKHTDICAIDWFMPKSLRKALENINIKSYVSKINKKSLKTLSLSKFDIITMWEVIEHLKINELKELFSYMHHILDDKGQIILSTPDFDDPHCKSLDFWSMAAGEHLSVFNVNSLGNILNNSGFFIEDIQRESVTIKKPEAWYEYGSLTNSSMAGQNTARMIEHVLSNDKLREEYKNYCRKTKIGSEMILFIKKMS